MRRLFLILTLLLSAAAHAAEIDFDIEAQPLANALATYAQQADLQVLFPQETVRDLRSTAVRGKLDKERALQLLLEKTGLQASFAANGTVLVKAAAASLLQEEGTPAQEMRVAQVGESKEKSAAIAPAAAPAADGKSTEEIVVTGTHIRGASPVGSPLIVIDREEIQSSGYGRIQDFLETVTQNFSGSVSEDKTIDFNSANNVRGQGIDLRGLGAGTTLILINGRRQPSGGLQGVFVDISSIATSAVERIEILPDGASALYGSDAIGGVVNFVLRKDYEGLETNVYLSSFDGAAEELHASQLWGERWTRGQVLVGYEYSHREALIGTDTPYSGLNQDFRSLGGSDFRDARANPGSILCPAGRTDCVSGRAVYAIPAGQNGVGLTAARLIPGQNFRDWSHDAALPEQTLHSAFFTLSQELGDRLEFFAEGRFGARHMEQVYRNYTANVAIPNTNPFYVNPFGTTAPVTVAYDFAEDMGGSLPYDSDTRTFGFTAGVRTGLGQEWELNSSATYGGEKNEWVWLNTVSTARRNQCITGLPSSGCPGAALNLLGDGANNDPATINFIRDTQYANGDYASGSLTAIADGPIFQLPAGTARLAIGADYRDDTLDADTGTVAPSTGIVTPSTAPVGNLDRQVAAVFAELVLPVLGRRGAGPSIGKLDVALAARYEDYSDFGTTLDPKIGINFTPIAGVRLRSSWGTSFRAPQFNQLSPTANPQRATGIAAYPDPRSSTNFSSVIVLSGGNPGLQEETADIWTAGFDFTPDRVPGLSISSTYFNIDYEGRIQIGGDGNNTLVFENRWAEIITRTPTAQQIADACSVPFTGPCGPGAAAIIDQRWRNIGIVRVRGIDFDLGYRTALPLGELRLGLAGTKLLTHEFAVSSTAPLSSVLDTVNNPLALHLRTTTSWNVNRWSIGAFVNYADSYDNPGDLLVLNRKVDSWTTVDASVSYRFEGDGWWDGTRIQLGVVNLFDEKPPFVNQSLGGFGGYDPANASQAGRATSLNLTRAW